MPNFAVTSLKVFGEQVRLLSGSLVSNPELALYVRSLTVHYWYWLGLVDKDHGVGAGDLLAHLVNLRSLTLVQTGPGRLLGSSCPL